MKKIAAIIGLIALISLIAIPTYEIFYSTKNAKKLVSMQTNFCPLQKINKISK
jgi:hypothetical protein